MFPLPLLPSPCAQVRRFWVEEGKWYDGVISDHNARTGEHCVSYHLGMQVRVYCSGFRGVSRTTFRPAGCNARFHQTGVEVQRWGSSDKIRPSLSPPPSPKPYPPSLTCFIYWQKSESFEWLNVAALLEGPVSPLPCPHIPPSPFHL